VTFGCFGALIKYTDRALDLWCRVLEAVPGSRMVIKSAGLRAPAAQSETAARFAGRGIDPSRITMLANAPTTADHLAMYGRMDIALDTFPYHGTTTTCEALWMGVPSVSRIGDSHASRVGLSLLSACGFPQWAARGDDEFVGTCSALAADVPALAALRRTLRPKMAASPLCDGAALCRRFENAIRDAWRRWCAART
jgi:predicted O-linked N-acetylglucosamine transferase (SPINDLY family)